jgi:hypothetical protein
VDPQGPVGAKELKPARAFASANDQLMSQSSIHPSCRQPHAQGAASAFSRGDSMQ